MQYSPYSATMNPYQTIYNNGGAGAYQPTWGYSDLFAHTLGVTSSLPLGYTRQQYNEERALAAESMWKSPLLGLGTFGVGTVASYAMWGSPFQDLANKVGGGAAFQAGFSNTPNAATQFLAQRGLDNAAQAVRDGLQRVRAGSMSNSELRNLWSSYRGAVSNLNAVTNAMPLKETFWGRVGQISGAYSNLKESTVNLTANIFRGVGSGIGKTFEVTTGGFGSIIESQINKVTGNVMSPWLEKTGQSLFDMTENGWMGKALGQAETIAAGEARAASLMARASRAANPESAGALITQAERTLARVDRLKGGILGGAKRYLASGAKSIGTILKSGGGISGLISAGGGKLLTAGLGLTGTLAASFLNPITIAEMYMLEQSIGYATETYQNYQTENEIKRNLMAKGGRILQYGFADGARGLQGGFSVSQQDQLVSTIRKMAAVGASQGDAFGLGADSLFGGHTRYSERLKELKSILNVGTDMGFFDMSRSMDDFEKKFKQTVETVDKLAKMLKRTKGEIMTVMANVQNTEGLYNMGAINASVLKKDYASRLSGVDLTTAMQESAAGAQMGRQHGFSAAMGANLMSESRILMSNALRSGDLTREDIFRLGGEQGVVTNLQQGYLNAMDDPVVQAELAMGMVRDPATGKMTFSADRLKRLATASDAELRRMSRERTDFMTTRSYSRIRQATFAGGRMYDAMRYLRTALAKGEVSLDQYNMAIAGAVRQKMLRYHMDESSAQYQETLRLELEGLTGDPDSANIIAKQMLGGYAGMQAHNDLAVAVDRYRSGYDKSDFGFMTMLNASSNNMGRGAGLLGAAFVGGIATVASGGAAGLIGATVGYNLGQLAYTGAGILANKIDPSSNLALMYRDQVKQELRAKGINPNYLDSYLFGKSDAEKVSEYSREELVNKLAFSSAHNFITSRYGNTGDMKSANWIKLEEGSREFKAFGDNKKEELISKAERANNASLKGVNGTLAGYLNYLSSDLKEFGLSNEEIKAIKGIQSAIQNGEVYDTTGLRGDPLKKIGRVIETSIQAGMKAGLDRDTMLDTIMNTLQTDTGDWATGRIRVTEAYLREKSAGYAANERLKGEASLYGKWFLGATTATEERIANRGGLLNSDYARSHWVKTALVGGAGIAYGFFTGGATTGLAYQYLNAEAKAEYLKKYKSALDISDSVAASLDKVIADPTAANRAWLSKNLKQILPLLDKDTFAEEGKLIRTLSEGGTLSADQMKTIRTFSTNLLYLKDDKALDRMARKATGAYSSRIKAGNRTKLDEYIAMLTEYSTAEGAKGFEGKLKKEGFKDAREFIKEMVDEGKIYNELFHKGDRERLEKLLENKGLNGDKLLRNASAELVASEIDSMGKEEVDKKGKVDYAAGNGGDIAYKTSELCHTAATILQSVIGRLGY